jgi:hypothetical protein
MQSTPIPFAAIAALALCAIIATKAQADGDFFFSNPRATGACEAARHASDGKRRRAVATDCRRGSPSKDLQAVVPAKPAPNACIAMRRT